MIDLKGKLVKLIFKNGMTAEGVVASWSSETSILNNTTDLGYLIIHKTLENVMMIRVIEQTTKEPISKQVDLQDANTVAEVKHPRVWLGTLPNHKHKISEAIKNKDNEAIKDLAKQQSYDQKKYISEKLKNTTVVPEVNNYEYPDFTKFKPINRSSKKNN